MHVTLLMAITLNGYIAGLDDDTDWVKDMDLLTKKIAEMGIVIYGKRTYDECMKYDVFPYPEALNIIMTHNQQLLTQTTEQVIFTDQDPQGVLAMAQQRGFEKVLLIGGGQLNGSFMQAGLVDEIVVDIHPLIKAKGIHLFEKEFSDQRLELTGFSQLNNQLLQATYKVIKT